MDARTGTTHSGRSATDVSSRGFSSIPKPPLTPSGSPVSAIGSAPVSFLHLSSISFLSILALFLHFSHFLHIRIDSSLDSPIFNEIRSLYD